MDISVINDTAASLTGGGWTYTPIAGAYGGDQSFAGPSGTGTNKATWSLTGLTAGDVVAIAWTWPTDANRATNTPWTVYDSDGTTVLASGTQNQETAPASFTDGPFNWQDVGLYTISGTSIHFEITDDANEYVIADAVRFAVITPASDLTHSVGSGDWSASGTWSNGVPDGTVNKVVINSGHSIVGDAIAADVLTLELFGPLAIADGVTLTVTGSVTQGDAPFTLGAGSALELDATAGDVVWTRGTLSGQLNCKIIANGTANVGDPADAPITTTGGTHARIFKTGANDAYFLAGDTGGTYYLTGGYELNYCEVEDIADSTGFWALPLYTSQDLLALHCSFDGCGEVFGSPNPSSFGIGQPGWFPAANNDFRIEYSKFTNSASDEYIVYCPGDTATTGSGTQTFIGNGVGGAPWVNLHAGVLAGCYWDESVNFGASPFATFGTDQLIRYGSNLQSVTYPVEDCYLLSDNREPNVGNQHFLPMGAPANCLGNTFETIAHAIDTPDAFYGTLGTNQVKRNLVIPSIITGECSSCLLNPGTGYDEENPWDLDVENNSMFGTNAQLIFMENTRTAGIYAKFRGNLVASPTLDDARYLADIAGNVDAINNLLHTHNRIHNGFSDADPDSSVVRIGYSDTRMTTEPAGPNVETSGAGYDGTGPQPVDATRNAARYAVFKGWVGAEPALAHDDPDWLEWLYDALDAFRDAMIADPREGPVFRDWVRAGFAPQNPDYEDADQTGAHAPGAIDFVAVGSETRRMMVSHGGKHIVVRFT